MPVVPVAGNQYALGVGKQSAKGTAAANSLYKLKVTGGDLAPARSMIQLAETDSTRQEGATIVTGASIAGQPSFYLRPSDAGLLFLLGLGADTVTGSLPNYTHTIAPAAAPIYSTWWKNQGASTILDKYFDVVVNSLHITGGQGQPLTITPDLYGLNAVLSTTDYTQAVVTETPYVYPEVTVTKAGSAPGTVESFDITVSNSGAPVGGDSGIFPVAVNWGRLIVTGTINILFQTNTDYNSFHTGTSGGVAVTTTVLSEALSIKATRDANTSVDMQMTGVTYTSYPVAPNTDGSPLRVAAAFHSLPQSTLPLFFQAVVKNAVPSYPGS